MGVEPVETLKACEAQFTKGYLEWRVMFSRIKKQSSITTYWKVHSMLYMNVALRYMEDDALLDIRNVWTGRSTYAQDTNCLAVDSCVLDTYLQA
jgi:hypothetical protein